MHDRIYICHTFYHVLITFLKEFKLREEGGSEDAVLVLSLMSNDFKGLKDRALATGFFSDVLEFDEKREDHFPELTELKKDKGNIVLNMLQRIRFTKRFGELEEPFVPVDMRDFKDIYVFCDTDPIGNYLNTHHIYYHALEDGLDCLKTLDMARISNAGHFGLKTFFAAMGLIFIENGYARYCIDMEINDRSVLKYDHKKYKEVPRAPLWKRLKDDEKELLLTVFVENKKDIEEKALSAGGNAVLILSDPLSDMDTRRRIMEDLLKEYGSDNAAFIKPHPRDALDYRKEFPFVPCFDAAVPMELLGFFKNIHFSKIISVYTELGAVTFADEKIRLGHDFMDKYEPVEMHRHKI